MINLKNTYLSLPNSFYEKARAEKIVAPSLIAFNQKLSRDLGFGFESSDQKELLEIFSGQKIIENSTPIALAYAGFQFGHPVPVLGDGRALLLGEINGYDIQLKGSGRTPFSRRGDGKSALGPVLREYLVSEAMHTLGVPTTRALAAVGTNENVYRQFGPEPGGIFTRVASSHLRVGTFQYFAFKKDIENLKLLLRYSVKRHYLELNEIADLSELAVEFLKSFALRQGQLIAKWSSLGFIHGVMNTDNCSIAGITIDYGPCAFMDEFKFNEVFSSIDKEGRYSFFNQVPIIQWNILRLADCLIPIIDEDEKVAVSKIEKNLFPILDSFSLLRLKSFAYKLGIKSFDHEDNELVIKFLSHLEQNRLDFTLSFRNLKKAFDGEDEFFKPNQDFRDLLANLKKKSDPDEDLNQINPILIPRNHLIQKAIDLAYEGNFTIFNQLLNAFEKPFNEYEELKQFYLPPNEKERVLNTFCGT